MFGIGHWFFYSILKKIEERSDIIIRRWTLDVHLCLVPMLLRGNPYGMHSHAGAWERENLASLPRPGVVRQYC